ncbi:MAG: sphingomyelin phosphodiesterase [Proteobacteria bacterium]|nr:sphingomyelin phosphodiesterase [Pseudomonadota bacterium]
MRPGTTKFSAILLFAGIALGFNQQVIAQETLSKDGDSIKRENKTAGRDSKEQLYRDSTKQLNTITVMTYNIQQLGYANWMANHFEKERLALIPETILFLEEKPDILIFQEVFTEYSFTFLVKELSQEFPYHTEVVAQDCTQTMWTSVQGDCRTNSFKGNGGVSIFSRWPITAKHAYVYRSVRISSTLDFMAQKGAVYASILIGEQQVHVLGTHLQADSGSHDIRMQQLEEMRIWFDSFNVPESEAVILGGDFNVSSNDTDKLAELLSVTMSRFELSNQNFGSISSGTNRYLNLISSRNSEKTLDFILYRTDHLLPINRPMLKVLDFKSSRLWTGFRLFRKDIELNDLSDHYPAIAVFQY